MIPCLSDTIPRSEALRLGCAPDATHLVLRADGEIYFCVQLKSPDETSERGFWSARGMAFKKIDDGAKVET